MKCINAEWEIRNLGVRTVEISVEKKDLELSETEFLQAVENYRQQYSAKYVVVKSDTRYPAISFFLQKTGYWLIENQIGLKLYREDAIRAFEEYKNLFEGVSYRQATEGDMEIIYRELKRGMFKTDRIALDPFFGVEIANRRYAFWIKDAVNQGAKTCICLYKNNPVGFSVDKEKNNKIYDSLLGGIFARDELHNFGAAASQASTKKFIDGNYEFEKTAVSSNNLNVLQLHLMFGRKIDKIKNVFVKHFD